jgi:hypothetical protein
MEQSTETLIDEYLSAYCEPDREQRVKAVSRLWAIDGRLTDPPMEAFGHEAIVAQTDVLLGQFPAHRFCRTTAIDAHHGFARYGWTLVNATGTLVLEGCDFAEIDEGGRLRRVVGFFGSMALLAAAT